MYCLPIPDDAFQALRLPPGRAEEELRREFAVFLVKEGLLEPSRARTIAAMDRLAFQDLLARREVAWSGSPEDAIADMHAAKAAMPQEQG
jgi:predicted HTH domain antitoxin